MTAEEFLLWNLTQDQRYELVDGQPVPLRAMSGASAFHDEIVVNIIAAMRAKLRDAGCSPRTADTAVRTAIKRVRRPDVTIECAPPQAKIYEARNPIAVFEVMSPGTRGAELLTKHGEYVCHPTIQMIISIDPDAHAIDGFDDCRYGVLAAQKGGMTKENNLSSYGLKEFEVWLRRLKKLKEI